MTKLEKLYDLAHKNNIAIHFFDLTEVGVLGLNIKKEGLHHMIFLDLKLKSNNDLHLEVLAHELGHYFTTVGNTLNNKNYRDRLYNNKFENKADKWACEFLITEEEIINTLNKNITNIYDIAEYLGVPLNILKKRLEYLSLQKQSIKVSDNKYLILTNLPNIYFYESF